MQQIEAIEIDIEKKVQMIEENEVSHNQKGLQDLVIKYEN